MKVDVLFFEGCPNHARAVALVEETVAELGVAAEVREIEVKTDRQAARLRFLGSPSIHVDGIDIEPGAAHRTDYAMSCRVYDGLGLPRKELLAAAMAR